MATADGASVREVVVAAGNGLHARPAARIAALARRYDAELRVECDGRSADARSIVALLTLNAAPGRRLVVSARGADSARALDALCALIGNGFDEEPPDPPTCR